jgi:hypothetical protein
MCQVCEELVVEEQQSASFQTLLAAERAGHLKPGASMELCCRLKVKTNMIRHLIGHLAGANGHECGLAAMIAPEGDLTIQCARMLQEHLEDVRRLVAGLMPS